MVRKPFRNRLIFARLRDTNSDLQNHSIREQGIIGSGLPIVPC